MLWLSVYSKTQCCCNYIQSQWHVKIPLQSMILRNSIQCNTLRRFYYATKNWFFDISLEPIHCFNFTPIDILSFKISLKIDYLSKFYSNRWWQFKLPSKSIRWLNKSKFQSSTIYVNLIRIQCLIEISLEIMRCRNLARTDDLKRFHSILRRWRWFLYISFKMDALMKCSLKKKTMLCRKFIQSQCDVEISIESMIFRNFTQNWFFNISLDPMYCRNFTKNQIFY